MEKYVHQANKIIGWYTKDRWEMIAVFSLVPWAFFLLGFAGPWSLAAITHATFGLFAYGAAIVFCLAKFIQTWEE